jgi:hypothetical protein
MEERRKHPFEDVYRVREELSAEYLALTPDEQKRRINDLTRRLAAEYGFTFAPAPPPRQDPQAT